MFEGIDAQIEIDPDTGLPALPRGQFWRVKPAGIGGTLVAVQLRKKVWFWSVVVDDYHAFPSLWPSVEQTVRYGAERIIKDQQHKLKQNRGMHRVAGDYPPKKLGGKK